MSRKAALLPARKSIRLSAELRRAACKRSFRCSAAKSPDEHKEPFMQRGAEPQTGSAQSRRENRGSDPSLKAEHRPGARERKGGGWGARRAATGGRHRGWKSGGAGSEHRGCGTVGTAGPAARIFTRMPRRRSSEAEGRPPLLPPLLPPVAEVPRGRASPRDPGALRTDSKAEGAATVRD